MRRAGNLWSGVLDRDTLLLAFWKAARGKRGTLEVRRFASSLDQNLERLREEVAGGIFELGRHRVFKVYEPKERTIHAARFVERVFHHALMAVCEPVFERQAVFHSYACRVGKGRLRAIGAAERAAGRAEWYLKLDISRYFESVPHDRLLKQVRRAIKDATVLDWIERVVRSHESGPGRGLPIGNLTSQHLANFYLNRLDEHCQGLPGVMAYARYMDDFVCWSQDKASMVAAGRSIEAWLGGELGLALKHPPAPQRTSVGMDFLGYRIHRSHTTLSRRSKVRYRRKLETLAKLAAEGEITERGLQERCEALTAFCRPVRSWRFRQQILQRFGSAAIGLEPGDPRGQLEQQRQQRPFGQPQQQQPGQPEQQLGVPLGSQLSLVEAECLRLTGTEPAVVPTDRLLDRQKPVGPPGVGRSGVPGRRLPAVLGVGPELFPIGVRVSSESIYRS